MDIENIPELPAPMTEVDWREYFQRVLDHVRYRIPPDRPDLKLPEYFRGVLDYAESPSASNSEEIAEALYNLAMSQQYTNTPLSEKIRRRIELWIQKAWNSASESLAERIVRIAQMLDLSNSLQLLKQSLKGELPETVRALIDERRPPLDIKNVGKLPDSMGETDLRGYFRDVLDYAESTSANKPEEIADALWELSVRQWHTYILLEDDLRERVELWIQRAWSPTSEFLVRRIVGIVGMLGLPKSLQLLKQSLKGELKTEVRSDIEGGIKQFGDTINDPYTGMNRFK